MSLKADRIIFVCILLLASVYFYAIEQIPTLQIGDPMGAKAIPRMLGFALLISAGLLLMEIRAADKTAKDEAMLVESAKLETEVAAEPQGNGSYYLVAAVVIWTAVYFAFFEWLGYAIATTIYLNVLMAYFNKGKALANILTATLFSFGSYLAFTKLFGTPLAPGLLPF